MVDIRGRVGGNIGTGLVFGRGLGGPIWAGDPKAIVDRYQAFVRRVMAVAPRATAIALLPTFAKSQIYCPKKTGDLVSSGYLEVKNRFASIFSRGVEPFVEMGYGKNGQPPYALIVHEMMEYYHKPPTRAKWLEAAMKEDFPRLLPRIASLLRV